MLLFNFQFVEFVGEQIQNGNRGAQMRADELWVYSNKIKNAD